MNDSGFQPHLTVATVVERDGRLLFVEELSGGEAVLNQPAGHVEPGESLVEAAVRETLEETGWHIDITAVLGIALYRSEQSGTTYHRTTFIGEPLHPQRDAELDSGIIAAHWLTPEEARQHTARPRSPLVLHCMDLYLSGSRYPLDLIY